MELLFIALLLAASYLIILFKVFGVRKILHFHILVDLVAMIGVPIIALGSYNGLVVAIILRHYHISAPLRR